MQRFEYNGARRLGKAFHQVNEQPEVLLVHNQYDELGRLKGKTQGNAGQSEMMNKVTGRNSALKSSYGYMFINM